LLGEGLIVMKIAIEVRMAWRLGVYLCAAALFGGLAAAEDVRSYTTKTGFDEVQFELTNAIIGRGLTIDYAGNIGRMLERTGPDVGSVKPLYTRAEFVMFCSAKLSRAMMEADLGNIGFCPYVIFLYEAAARPGETVVGYRRPISGGGTASPVLAEIDSLLDAIAKDAVK
jgi:hypothetical protein